jgi:hypothetical protein
MIKITILIICIIIFVVKKINSSRNRNKDQNLFGKAKADPAFAASLIDDVRLFYCKAEYADFDMKRFREELKDKTFGHYKVVDSIESGNKLLLFTNRIHEDFGMKWNGHTGDVKKEQYDFFVLENDAEKKCVYVYGDNYLDLNDKVMKTDFAQAMVELVS